MDIKTLLTTIHIFGVTLGAGAAFIGDWIFLHSMQDKHLSKDEHRILNAAGHLVWIGLGILYLSGAGLVYTDPIYFLTSEKFLLKAAIVLIITLNGFVLHAHHMPFLGKYIGKRIRETREIKKRTPRLVLSGAVSVVSWSAAIILGSLRLLPLSIEIAILIYISLIAATWIVGMLLSKRYLRSK